MIQKLKEKQLVVAPEKVQKGKVIHYLGSKITERYITPQKIQIRTDHLRTLNDFQKLLADITLLHSYLKLTRGEFKPLFYNLIF